MKKIPLILLIMSVASLLAAISIAGVGTSRSKIYRQMVSADIFKSLDEISDSTDPFLVKGRVKNDHKTVIGNLVSYGGEESNYPTLTITLQDGDIKLLPGYSISEFNEDYTEAGEIYQGIKAGSDITIFAIKYNQDGVSGIKGYELYPGMPKQYLNSLYTPYTGYKIYVRIIIGLALLFFVLSAVLNKKK